MAYDRFMIAPYDHGLETNVKPWMINDDAWAQLNNAYAWRGRIRKRFGEKLMGNSPYPQNAQFFARLAVALGGGAGHGVTDVTGHADGTVPGHVFGQGQMFYIGGDFYTQAIGTPGAHQMLRSDTSTVIVATYNNTTGAYFIDGAPPLTQVYFYPSLPVMGFANYEKGPINDHPSFAWDTEFVYKWVTTNWVRETAGTPEWHGDDTNFFWTTNWQGVTDNDIVLFVTNFNAGTTVAATDDPLWSYNGTTWADFSPFTVFLTGGNYVQTCRLIVAFKNRLLLMNTIESNALHTTYTVHKNRCRYSHNGSPFAGNAFLEPNQSFGGSDADGAGWIDATTEEAIVSAEFIRNRLIVYFERSTWELVYTGNEIQPFIWQKINTELGSEATFSIVPFDKVVLGIGNTGVHSCNGANTERIDIAIPDQIFQIENKNEGVERVAGIRDYYVEMVYWTMPSTTDPQNKFPDKVLVFNYKNSTWSFNDDCITAFGYFEQQTDTTWSNTTFTWASTAFTWTSGVVQSQFRQVLAGNQQGCTFLVVPDITRNCAAMSITNMVSNVTFTLVALTVIDHNLKVGDYIEVNNAIGVAGINGGIYSIAYYIDADTVVIPCVGMTGTYAGGGTIERVSQISMLSKQFNPYAKQNKNVYIGKVDFLVDKTSEGEITVDYYPSTTNQSMLADAIATNSILGTGTLETSPYALYPLENLQERLWHPTYLQTNAEAIQLRLYHDNTQMSNPAIVYEDFQLHAMTLYTSPIGRLE